MARQDGEASRTIHCKHDLISLKVSMKSETDVLVLRLTHTYWS